MVEWQVRQMKSDGKKLSRASRFLLAVENLAAATTTTDRDEWWQQRPTSKQRRMAIEARLCDSVVFRHFSNKTMSHQCWHLSHHVSSPPPTTHTTSHNRQWTGSSSQSKLLVWMRCLGAAERHLLVLVCRWWYAGDDMIAVFAGMHTTISYDGYDKWWH